MARYGFPPTDPEVLVAAAENYRQSLIICLTCETPTSEPVSDKQGNKFCSDQCRDVPHRTIENVSRV